LRSVRGNRKIFSWVLGRWLAKADQVSPNSFSGAAVAADAEGEAHVLGRDGDALCVDCAQVCVLEEADEVGLAGLLEGEEGVGLNAEVLLVAAEDLLDEALEGQLLDEEVSALLELPAASGKVKKSEKGWSFLRGVGEWGFFT